MQLDDLWIKGMQARERRLKGKQAKSKQTKNRLETLWQTNHWQVDNWQKKSMRAQYQWAKELWEKGLWEKNLRINDRGAKKRRAKERQENYRQAKDLQARDWRAKAILFDLDGTLLDTAGDLFAALNRVLADYGKPALDLSAERAAISSGAAGLIKLGFGLGQEQADSAQLQQRLVDYYRLNIGAQTRLFDGMETLLDRLDRRRKVWGIVTNKSTDLTTELLKALNLLERPHCVVCRDTTAEAKPSPMPLLHACKLTNLDPSETLYIGDAISDIQAANRAGMISLVAQYGYLSAGEEGRSWGADGLINHPDELAAWLDFA